MRQHQQQFQHNHIGQVVGHQTVEHQEVSYPHPVLVRPDELPPLDPAVSLECPQCTAQTWSASQHCRYCRFDLFAWRQQLHDEEERVHRIYRRERVQRRALIAGLLCMLAFVGAQWLPKTFGPVVGIMGLLGMLAAVKTLARAEANT